MTSQFAQAAAKIRYVNARLPWWVPKRLRRVKIDRAAVSLDKDKLCKIGRSLQWILRAISTWTRTEVDDKAFIYLREALDSLGCK